MSAGLERLLSEVSEGWVRDGMAPPRLRATSIAQAARALALASELRLPVCVEGLGLRSHWGQPTVACAWVLDPTALESPYVHAHEDLVVSAPAGMTLQALNERLAQFNQILPLEVPAPHLTTLGGLVAAAPVPVTGAYHGNVRDWVIGLEVITPLGEVIRAGSRVVKNVAGYDLCKLYTGSLGTLGAIASVTFRLRPRWAHTALMRIVTTDNADRDALLLRLGTAEVDPAVAVFEFESGVAWLGFDGDPEAIEEQLRRVTAWHLAGDAETWQGEQARLLRASLIERTGGTPAGWRLRVGALPESLPELWDEFGPQARSMSALVTRGIAWVEADPALAPEGVLGWRENLRRRGGHLVIERAPDGVAIDRLGLEPATAELMAQVLGRLDPAGVMAPGRWGAIGEAR